MLRQPVCALVLTLGAAIARPVLADVPIGGFLPFLGIGLTDEFETFDSDPTGAFFVADPSFQWGGSPLGPGSAAFFDVALLDTGAATHILTPAAASSAGFSIQAEGFRGTQFQTIFGASGAIDLRINDPLGVYAAGFGDRTSAGSALVMDTSKLRGQTSVAMLEAPASWELPNILGLPIVAHHAIAIRNDQPQIFQHQGRTMRTPNIQLIDLGSGGELGITRRTNLRIRPSASFLAGPLYIQSIEIGGGLDFNFHDNPLSPTVIDSGAMFVEVDIAHGTRSFQDKEFLFDTGADLSVLSEVTAARLGIDVEFDQPDFVLQVEGAGGVTDGVPGYYLDELNIDTVGGSFTLHNVPVAVLDLPNPNDPANVYEGIVGMHLFTGRNIVIDPIPAPNQIGGGPRLYIGDPVTQTHAWAIPGTGAEARIGAFTDPNNWSSPGALDALWVAELRNTIAEDQTSLVTTNAVVNQLHVAGAQGHRMRLDILTGATLTTFGETRIDQGGSIFVVGGGKLDAQFVTIQGGSLVGSGAVFVGAGPVHGAVRNLSGVIDPGAPLGATFGALSITGDVANLADGTIVIDLGGTTAVAAYDQLQVSRYAFLNGTLEVRLASFAPNIGSSFTILTAGEGVVGQFDNLVLPGGFQWDVDYQSNAVVLEVAGLTTLLGGDFDGNGRVDAADLAVWKAGFGTTYDGDDFLKWQASVGGIVSATAVAEPAARGLMALAAATFAAAFNTRAGRGTRSLSASSLLKMGQARSLGSRFQAFCA